MAHCRGICYIRPWQGYMHIHYPYEQWQCKMKQSSERRPPETGYVFYSQSMEVESPSHSSLVISSRIAHLAMAADEQVPLEVHGAAPELNESNQCFYDKGRVYRKSTHQNVSASHCIIGQGLREESPRRLCGRAVRHEARGDHV